MTNTDIAPWIIIEANRKNKARIGAIKNILKMIDYIPKDDAGIDFIIDKEKEAN